MSIIRFVLINSGAIMKKHLFLVGAFTFLISVDVIAQADYLEYTDKVKVIAQMAHSAKSCEHSRMIINWNELNKVSDELIKDAIVSGIDLELARGIILDALNKQREKEATLVEFYKNNPDRANEFIEYWAKRCAYLAGHDLTKRFIKYPN
jgi:hypothetical protein